MHSIPAIAFLVTAPIATGPVEPKAASHVAQARLSAEKNIYSLFPSSPSQVRKIQAAAEENLTQKLTNIAHLAPDKRNFTSVCLNLDQAVADFMNTRIMLKNLKTVTEHVDVIEAGQTASDALAAFFSQEIERLRELQHVFLELANDAEQMSGYQRLYLRKQLATLKVSKLLENHWKSTLETLASSSDVLFLALKGQAQEIIPQKEFTLLQFNICAFGGTLPLLFGGVLPWKDRIDRIIAKIKELNPDVLCLQEVFDRQAGQALYEGLRDTYAYFYTDIDPRVLGFDLNQEGFNSGLFVASKYKIEKPACYPLKDRGPAINRALFGVVTADAEIYTTHYEAGNFSPGPERRASQLWQTIQIMENNRDSLDPKPQILTGDLNIALGLNIPNQKKEPGEAYINQYFYDAYNAIRDPINQQNYAKAINKDNWTSLDYTYYWFQARQNEEKFAQFQLKEPPEIVDYTLLLTKDIQGQKLPQAFTPLQITTFRIPNSSQDPLEMLSDHYGMLSTIKQVTEH